MFLVSFWHGCGILRYTRGERKVKRLSQELLAKLIKDKRSEKGITQETLCALSDINRAMISRIERCDYMPTIEQLEKLAEVLEFDIQQLFVEKKPRVYTAFRGSNLSEEERDGVEHLMKMMLVAKQQITLRKALHHES